MTKTNFTSNIQDRSLGLPWVTLFIAKLSDRFGDLLKQIDDQNEQILSKCNYWIVLLSGTTFLLGEQIPLTKRLDEYFYLLSKDTVNQILVINGSPFESITATSNALKAYLQKKSWPPAINYYGVDPINHTLIRSCYYDGGVKCADNIYRNQDSKLIILEFCDAEQASLDPATPFGVIYNLYNLKKELVDCTRANVVWKERITGLEAADTFILQVLSMNEGDLKRIRFKQRYELEE
jgi:hypothetical protein